MNNALVRTLSIAALVVGTLTSSVTGQQLTIEKVAPKRSVLVAAVPDAGEAFKRFERTGFPALWQSEGVRRLRWGAIFDGRAGFQWRCERWGYDHKTLPRPQGHVGLAVFPGPDGADYLLVADFGVDADRAARLFDALFAEVEAEEGIERRVEEVRGRIVTSVVSSTNLLQDYGLVGIQEMVPIMPVLGAQHIVRQHWLGYVRDGNRFIFTSDSQELAPVLAIMDGGEPTGLAQREDFQAVREKIGPANGWAVMNLQGLVQMLAEEMDIGPNLMLLGALWTLVGDVEAIGVGVRVDGPSAMVQKTVAIHMPRGKSAVARLVDRDAQRGEIPAFIGPDAVGYATIRVRFDEFPQLLRDLGKTSPDVWDFVERFLGNYGEDVEQVCSNLGPRVHDVLTVTGADGQSSLTSLVAIQSDRAGQVEQVIGRHAVAFGLERRDAGEHRVYTRPSDGFSVGFGARHVMLGRRGVVEDALRLEATGDAADAAPKPAWARAMRKLAGDKAAAWGVQTRVDFLDHFTEFNQVVNGPVLRQGLMVLVGGFQMLGQGRGDWEPADPLDALDMEIAGRHVGPMAWQLREDNDGFTATTYLLAAPKQPEATAQAASESPAR